MDMSHKNRRHARWQIPFFSFAFVAIGWAVAGSAIAQLPLPDGMVLENSIVLENGIVLDSNMVLENGLILEDGTMLEPSHETLGEIPEGWHEFEIPEEHGPFYWQFADKTAKAVESPIHPLTSLFGMLMRGEHLEIDPWLHEEPIGIQPIQPRPALPIEWGEKYLGDEFLSEGVEMPTGAVWRPALWVWGTNRFGISYQDDRSRIDFVEATNRLDLFAQLNLSGTEHILFAMRPFDEEENQLGLAGREFETYDFTNGRWLDGMNGEVQSVYFEGDITEIFPNLDPYDSRFLDYGFSVGRQPMSFQRGLLINEDLIDAVTLTRNTANGFGNLNMRTTGVFAWNRVTRLSLPRNSPAKLFGIFTESDFAKSTVNVDAVFVESDETQESMAAFGVSSTQRFVGYENTYNTRFHVLGSFPTQNETAAAGQGELLFSQVSWTPHKGYDLIYWDTFWAIDQFTSPARSPIAGNLGDTGILFASAGLGRYGSPMSSASQSAIGSAIGYQMFFDGRLKQAVFEVGGRKGTGRGADGQIGAGFQTQTACGQHWILLFTGFGVKQESLSGISTGFRTELVYQF